MPEYRVLSHSLGGEHKLVAVCSTADEAVVMVRQKNREAAKAHQEDPSPTFSVPSVSYHAYGPKGELLA